MVNYIIVDHGTKRPLPSNKPLQQFTFKTITEVPSGASSDKSDDPSDNQKTNTSNPTGITTSLTILNKTFFDNVKF